MTMWKRWIQGGVLCGLLLGGVVGCSMVASPPVGEIAPGDHAALAAWYDKEAAQLRQSAKDEMAMAEEYRKHPVPSPSSRGMATATTKVDMVQHCEALADMYTKAAEEAEQLAQGHRGMLK
jgi:hypothetical protein